MRLRFPWTIVAGLVATLLVPVVVVTGSVYLSEAATALPPDAVLRADGVTVTKDEMQQQVRVLGALYGLRAPDTAGTDEFNRTVARALALRIVVDKAIAERHLTVPEARSRQLLADFIAHQVNPPGQAGFLSLLRDVGASQHDVVDELDRRESTRELYRQVTASAAAGPSEAEVGDYYRTHASQMVLPPRRQLRNIVVATRDQAAALLSDLRSGADFATVAAQSSLDERTRDSGGDLGVLSADELEGSYRAAAFSAPPGSVFGPVQTADGWNVGQVVEVHPEVPLSFADVHDQLAGWLRTQRMEQAWTDWLAARFAEADVRYAAEYRPTDPRGLGAVPDGVTTPVPSAREAPK